MTKEKVIIRRAAGYDPLMIQAVIEEGLKEFGLEDKARGRIKALFTLMPHLKMVLGGVPLSSFLKSLPRIFRK